MKGVIADCLAELVINNFGKDKWEDILEKSGLDKNTTFSLYADIDDSAVLHVIGNTCEVLGITMEQAADAFGDYWVNVYAPDIYWAYYRNWKSARDFLLDMDRIHSNVTRRIPNAHPPRFEYEWENENTLIMKYSSHRGLIDILVGLIKGVGKKFEEDITVSKIREAAIRIEFPS